MTLLVLNGCQPQVESGMNGRWYNAAMVEQGQQVFSEHCQSCHGAKAAGLTADWRKPLADGSYPPPPLNGSAHAWHHPLSQLKRTLVNGGIPLGGVMPAFGQVLDETEMDAAIAFFQSQWSDEIYAQWAEIDRQ